MTKIRIDALGGGVLLLTLADPAKRNAMGFEMSRELVALFATLRADGDTSALVVTGEGAAFCAGADLPEMFGETDRPTSATHARLHSYYQVFLAVLELPFPTIAAVNGPAVGAGLNLSLACDLRIAGPNAMFGATFARIGLHPGGGCTWFLVRALGASRALRTLLLGEEIDADRAVAWGLADGPEDDCLTAATDLAARIAALDPALARSIKRTVRLAADTGDLGAVLEYETWAQAASAASSPLLQAWVDRFRP
ncbi:MAG: enoyl-CoA hydratase-related protein [Egibacteraceae bacterium]